MTDDVADRRQRVVVLGASPKPERYSNRAVRLLVRYGHEVIPVHPSAATIEGLPAVAGLEQVDGVVDTVTVYVSAATSASLGPAIVELAPGRVIFNPGAENPDLQAELEREAIVVVNACTLVLLNTGQF
jgi:predicted CoA-binding protein